MDALGTVSTLNIFTLAVVLVVAIGSLLWFRRKRQNRHPMEYANPREEAAAQAARAAERHSPKGATGGAPPPAA